MIDNTESIIQNYDLLALAERDVVLKKSGAWAIGPCPFCGGDDRFNLQRTSSGYRWFCRQCGEGKYHDAAAYVMRRENVNFVEALKIMGGQDEMTQREKRGAFQEVQTVLEPTLIWRRRAADYVEECRQNLWKPAGAKALEWLRKERGFDDFYIAKYRLGYNPADRYEAPDLWGVDQDKKIQLERGITLPAIGPAGVDYIKVRRPIAPGSETGANPKYRKVRGGRGGVFGWQNLRGTWLAVATEGEFDCIALDQLAGAECAPFSLGGAKDTIANLSPLCLSAVIGAPHILVAFDNDQPGIEGAALFAEKLSRSKIATLHEAYHDLNDALKGGYDLGDWISREVERLGILAPDYDKPQSEMIEEARRMGYQVSELGENT